MVGCLCSVIAGFLASCENQGEHEHEVEGCDFTEKLVNISIDEQRKLLYDELFLKITLEKLKAVVDKEEVQRQQIENLVNQTRPSGTPYHHQSLSKKGKKTLVKMDLLEKLKNSSDAAEKEKWLALYNHLRWGELITDRAFIQECEERIVLKRESARYQTQSLESHFLEEATEVAKKNLYQAYSTPQEIAYLADSTNAYRYLYPKTGRGFSTGFFVKDRQNQREWKVKVGWEAYREPLATRIAWALGFYVDEVFHVRDLRVEFDGELERLFKDKDRKLADSLSGIILGDGTLINLIANPKQAINVAGIYKSYRSRIRYLIFKSVVLERRDPNIVRAGQWSFDALDNSKLRAIRMLGLLNFWLGNIDIKFDNNRIFLRCADSAVRGNDVFRDCVESGNYTYQFSVHDFGLSFASHPNGLNVGGHKLDIQRGADGKISLLIKTRERDVYAWRLITLEDAQAFAERLSQLTETQLRQAVAAAGYPYPALRLLVEKLKERRNLFLAALDENYLPLKVDFSLANSTSGIVMIGNGKTVIVPQDDFILSNGLLENDISLGKHGRHSEMIRE